MDEPCSVAVDLKPTSVSYISIRVKDYCVHLVNVLSIYCCEGNVNHTSASHLLPFPGLLLGSGLGAAMARAQGNGDISSLNLHCDPYLHLGWKTEGNMQNVIV